MFIGTNTGIVSATTRPPSSCARVDARSWRSTLLGTRRRSTVSTFQLSGRRAGAAHPGEQLDLVVAEPARQPSTMASSACPS